MNKLNRRGLTALAIGLGMVGATTAQGDILVTLMSDGSGGTVGSMVGTYDVSGSTSSGATAPVDSLTLDQPGDRLLWFNASTVQTGGMAQSIGGVSNTSSILNSAGSANSSLSTDYFGLILWTQFGGLAQIIVWDDASSNSGTLNETLSYGSLSFSSFNIGVWDWGNYDGVGNDGVRLQILDNVPTPGALAVGGIGLLAFGRRRRG